MQYNYLSEKRHRLDRYTQHVNISGTFKIFCVRNNISPAFTGENQSLNYDKKNVQFKMFKYFIGFIKKKSITKHTSYLTVLRGS